jgi:hypothetical protein
MKFFISLLIALTLQACREKTGPLSTENNFEILAYTSIPSTGAPTANRTLCVDEEGNLIHGIELANSNVFNYPDGNTYQNNGEQAVILAKFSPQLTLLSSKLFSGINGVGYIRTSICTTADNKILLSANLKNNLYLNQRLIYSAPANYPSNNTGHLMRLNPDLSIYSLEALAQLTPSRTSISGQDPIISNGKVFLSGPVLGDLPPFELFYFKGYFNMHLGVHQGPYKYSTIVAVSGKEADIDRSAAVPLPNGENIIMFFTASNIFAINRKIYERPIHFSTGTYKHYIVKLTKNNEVSWIVPLFESAASTFFLRDAIAVSDGFIVATGFSTDFTLQGQNFVTRGGNDALLLKFDFKGKLIWSKQFASAASEASLYSVIQIYNDQIYYISRYGGTSVLPVETTGKTWTSTDVIFKLDKNGNILNWVSVAGTNSNSPNIVNYKDTTFFNAYFTGDVTVTAKDGTTRVFTNPTTKATFFFKFKL